uniref:Cytochrome b-c1 complex subunit 2, mitochondrial n=1 Tax=Schistocephalus solidus TaxID=70667 RepID=A0A183TBT4_SCHSO
LCNVLAFPIRAAQTVALKSKPSDPTHMVTVAEAANGSRYACLPQPDGWKGIARLVAVVESGSRCERSPKERGLSHLLRRSCGLTTDAYTAVNLTRHIQQMGAELRCKTTREHLIYTIDVAANLAPRAGHLLAHMATHTLFYDWELKDLTYKLMQKDIDILNRRRLDALAVELLHEAAFGVHPDGSGLGNSLYATADKLGNYSLNDIHRFIERNFTPTKVAFAICGNGESVDGLEVCDSMCEAAQLHAPEAVIQPAKPLGFIGGEIRRNLELAEVTHAALAWSTPGREDAESTLALAVCSRALAPPITSIAYASADCTLNPPDSNTSSAAAAIATPLYHIYSDQGLFGFMVTGSGGEAVANRVCFAREQLEKLANNGLSLRQFQQAKMRLKAHLLMLAESQTELTEDVAVQLLMNEQPEVRSAEAVCNSIDALQLETVNKASFHFLRAHLCLAPYPIVTQEPFCYCRGR